MSQDVVADALNMIRNAKKARKESLEIKRISNLLIEVLKIMKQKGAIKRYKMNLKQKSVGIDIGDLTECRAVKPRFTVNLGFIALHSLKSPISISTVFCFKSILYLFMAPFCFMIFNTSMSSPEILFISRLSFLALFAFLIMFNASATTSCDIFS